MSLRLNAILSDEDFKKKMDKWRAVLLSIPRTFTEMTLSQMWKHSFNCRQAVMQEHESLSRTAPQSAMEVFHLKSLVENTTGPTKLSAQALSAELVKLGLQQVSGGSKTEEDEADNGSLTAGFIGQALTPNHPVQAPNHRALHGVGSSVRNKVGFSQNVETMS